MITTIACSLVFVGAILNSDEQISTSRSNVSSTCCVTDLTVTSNGHEFERAHNKLLELSNTALLNATNEKLNLDRLSNKLRQLALASVESNINEGFETHVKIISEMTDRVTLRQVKKRDDLERAAASCCTYYSQIMDHLVAVDNLISSFERKSKTIRMEKFAEEILPVITECKKVNMQIPPPDSVKHAHSSFTVLWRLPDAIIYDAIKTLCDQPPYKVSKYIWALFKRLCNASSTNGNNPCLNSLSSVYTDLNNMCKYKITEIAAKYLNASNAVLNGDSMPMKDIIGLMSLTTWVINANYLLSRIISIFESLLAFDYSIKTIVKMLKPLRSDIFLSLRALAKYKCEVQKHNSSTVLPQTEEYLKRMIENEKT